MQLSFLGLSVIPELRITDRGLVDVTTFSLTSVSPSLVAAVAPGGIERHRRAGFYRRSSRAAIRHGLAAGLWGEPRPGREMIRRPATRSRRARASRESR